MSNLFTWPCSLPWYMQGKMWATCKTAAAIGWPATMFLVVAVSAISVYIIYRIVFK